ncbi:MAG: flagellar motor protein MotB [Thermodesulfobacteriota bacterium]
MARKKSSASDQMNPLMWMVTFSDLVNLLLTFFVLLVSMASMDVKAMSQAFGHIFEGGSGPLDFADQGQMEKVSRLLESLEEVPASVLLSQEDLKRTIFESQEAEFTQMMDLLDRDITVFQDERGLVIRMADYILFQEGDSVLRLDYLPVLSRLANVLRMTRRPISIEGHTDDTVLEGGGGSFGWELSLNRAMAVMKYFTEEEGLLEESFRVAGYGASKPIAPNDGPVNRAKNRRIEIVLYRETPG